MGQMASSDGHSALNAIALADGSKPSFDSRGFSKFGTGREWNNHLDQMLRTGVLGKAAVGRCCRGENDRRSQQRST
jgi:hypothetical protein